MEYFECACHSSEHRLTFQLEPGEKGWPPEMYCEMHLNNYRNIFKRIWVAIKYILGYKCRYGHWDCFIMRYEEAPKMIKLCETFIKESDKWAEKKLGV